MNRKQLAILIALGTLVFFVFCGLGYAVISTTDTVDVPAITIGNPHKSPKRIARAWLGAAVAGRCQEAQGYVMPDANKVPFCESNGKLWLTQAKVDQADVDESNSPLLGDYYIVTFYGDFGFAKRVSHPTAIAYPADGPTPTPRPSYEKHLEENKIEVLVEEIDGRYYVSPWTEIFNWGVQVEIYATPTPAPPTSTPTLVPTPIVPSLTPTR
jgi:hypothetical protein